MQDANDLRVEKSGSASSNASISERVHLKDGGHLHRINKKHGKHKRDDFSKMSGVSSDSNQVLQAGRTDSTPSADGTHPLSPKPHRKHHSVASRSSDRSVITPADNPIDRHSVLMGGLRSSKDLERRNSRNTVSSRSSVKRNTLREQREFEKQKYLQPPKPKWAIMSRLIVENKYFICLTTVLTIYALIGDDLRLILTERPADDEFNLCTGFCLVVFSVEIILSCLGKEDYFPGFFFILDTVSTITLVLDITTVNDFVIQGDEEDVQNMSGFEAAQLAKAGRVVRVLRLVRILKLYKAVHEARSAKQRKTQATKPGEDDNWDDIAPEKGPGQQRESRVGKKLSDLTTRRVILLVLIMLLVLPFLDADEVPQLSPSASFGADAVNRAYDKMLAHKDDPTYRDHYERALLMYVYYHNWFTGQVGKDCPRGAVFCSGWYLTHVFWVGIVSKNSTELVTHSREAQLRPSTVERWEEEKSKQQDVFNYGGLPMQVQTILGGRWDAACSTRGGEIQRLGFSVLQETIEGKLDWAVRCPEDLRRVERKKYSPKLLTAQRAESWHFAFYFDARQAVRAESRFALIITAFICSVLCVSSLAFAADANALVLSPVENMISKVEAIRDNPLIAMKMADDEFILEEQKKQSLKRQQRHMFHKCRDAVMCSRHLDKSEPMETVILEKTIIKLGSLLALGFGEAGANIIEHNMHGVDSACVDAMVEGTKVDCVIGCCRILHFGVATEVLQEKVMTFVNQIAEVVHGVVDSFHGAANKNNGDMFLLIWRSTDFEEDDRQGRLHKHDQAKIADMSMLAFARILGAVHRSAVLAAYRGHPGLQQRLGRACRVDLTFGLHYGWAIEGAVGSEFKIDASYLSPNVSIAEDVLQATQHYNVNVMVAESVVAMCSPAMSLKCRRIDKVIMTGSSRPMELYVIDLDYRSLTVEPRLTRQTWNSKARFRVRQFLEQEKTAKLKSDFQMVDVFNEDPDVAAMRFRYTLEFTHVFNMGYQNYSQGEWGVAKRLLLRTRTMLGEADGPSTALLNYMERYLFQAPREWDGVSRQGR